MTTTTDQLLTYPEAAQRLGVGARDIQRMVRTEQLPAYGTHVEAGAYRHRHCRWLADRLLT